LWAVAAGSGLVLWSRDISSYTGVMGDRSRTSPAVYRDELILGEGWILSPGTSGARVFAVDRRTGALVWSGNVIFVAGAHKLVPTLAAAHERIYQHSLPLEDARAQAAYGQHSQVGKILEIHTELPGRIHVVLIRQQVGY
jgi:hypothetical protein